MADTALRHAKPAEAAALTALALRSKAHWPYDESLMSVFRRTIAISAADIDAHVCLVHETGGAADGVALLVVETDAAELHHLWVEPTAMGRGIGRRLFEAVAEEARRRGAQRLTLNSDPYAAPFYRHLGAISIGDHPVEEIPGRTIPRMAINLETG